MMPPVSAGAAAAGLSSAGALANPAISIATVRVATVRSDMRLTFLMAELLQANQSSNSEHTNAKRQGDLLLLQHIRSLPDVLDAPVGIDLEDELFREDHLGHGGLSREDVEHVGVLWRIIQHVRVDAPATCWLFLSLGGSTSITDL